MEEGFYNKHRKNKTWREEHGYTPRALRKRNNTTEVRTRNREPGRFGKVNWDSYQHDQLFDMIHKANLGAMSERAGQWNTLAARIESTTGEVQQLMESLMGTWRGQAAVSSASSNSKLMQWAGEASTTASKIAGGMSDYTDAVERAQKHMPEPGFADAERNFRNGYTVTGTGGPSTAVLLKELLSDGLVSHEEAKARKAEAVQVMENYESRSKDVHDTTPDFVPVKPATTDPLPPRTPTPEQADPTPSGRPGPAPGAQGSDTSSGTPGLTLPPQDTTTASSFVDPSLGTGFGQPNGAGGGPGGTGFGGGGGLGSLGSGGSDVVRNSPAFGAGGMSGAAPFGGRGPAGAGGMAGLGGRGAGAGGFGGMPMGGHGAPGEDDKEHKNKYDEGMDFLDDLPPAYPPVFGA
jgi:uncharacterized protein YukE